MAACSVADCSEPVFVKKRGWCRKHYHRWYRTGDPLTVRYQRHDGPPLERWWAKVNKQPGDGCWLWTGSLDRKGYGQFDVIIDGHHVCHRAHRWGYQQLIRPLDPSETLDHLCRVRHCVRPDHLDPVSLAENIDRGRYGAGKRRKTTCKRGHPLDATDKMGRRFCRTCSRDRSREVMRRRRGYVGTPPNHEKTHCKHGHEFTAENTIHRDGHRECRECARNATREYMRRKRAAST